MTQVEKDYYAATQITTSCRERIKNLVNNASASNTTVKKDCVIITADIGSIDNEKLLYYTIPVKFLREDQLNYLKNKVS